MSYTFQSCRVIWWGSIRILSWSNSVLIKNCVRGLIHLPCIWFTQIHPSRKVYCINTNCSTRTMHHCLIFDCIVNSIVCNIVNLRRNRRIWRLYKRIAIGHIVTTHIVCVVIDDAGSHRISDDATRENFRRDRCHSTELIPAQWSCHVVTQRMFPRFYVPHVSQAVSHYIPKNISNDAVILREVSFLRRQR